MEDGFVKVLPSEVRDDGVDSMDVLTRNKLLVKT